MTQAACRIVATPNPSGTELRLQDGGRQRPFSGWGLSGHRGFDLCQRFLIDGDAIPDAELLLVEHAAIARLTASEAARLNLPALSTLRASVDSRGVMVRPDFSVTLRWTRSSGQNVLGVERVGAWLREAEGWRRLPETLFAIAQAVSAYQAVPPGDEAARLRAVAALREALPPGVTAGNAEAGGMLGTVTILEADALSLETMGEGDAMQLVPVLHRAGPDAPPLLPEDRAGVFRTQFHGTSTVRSVYSLPGGVYIALSPPLRQALQVVRRAAGGSPAERRALLRAPRAAIRVAIGDEADEAVLEALVVETSAWSDRVVGLGLWERRVLPWIMLGGSDWFGGAGHIPGSAGGEPKGLLVDDRRVPLSSDAAAALGERIEAAIAEGRTSVVVETNDGPVEVPATPATLMALASVASIAGTTQPEPDTEPASTPLVLLIKANESARDIEAMVRSRTAPPNGVPSCLRATLKAHQVEGLAWLQQNWVAGSPGVLLADDMGLGKTLQGLAFLAWLREGMQAGTVARAPLLIVAPTGLLENWRAEHERHLAAPGLGRLVLAYGQGLAALRHSEADGTPGLDRAKLLAADWVLTTYETLRDHDRDFGQVAFAAMLLDEAQKVKTPGIRLTDAAKGMNVDFRVALTGTPVENRLADLWCIVDGVAAGHLGDLRWFSATYEKAPTPEKLAALKTSLDHPFGARPPLLLRRLRRDRPPDLPPCRENILTADMPASQLLAYQEALALARSDQGAGRVLQALQRIRAVSLHPDPEGAIDDDALITGSARLGLALGVLDEVAKRGERVLVFVETQAFMARLVGLLQRRYQLANPPMTISGKVAGAARQARVNRFQEAPDRFDVMLLSPKAGGVGLTLTRANHVVHLERWWNPAVEDQCTGRVLRIGQERPVTIHIPLATLPFGQRSFDENLHDLLNRKRGLMHDALLPPEAAEDELSAMLDQTL